MFKCSLYRYSTRPQMTFDIHLQKTNTEQNSISLLGPKTWSKTNPSIKNIKTTSSFMHALYKNILFHCKHRLTKIIPTLL